MTCKDNLIKESSYFSYIFCGCFSIITFILVLVSMGLWDKKNSTIDLLIPVLHAISQLIVVVGIFYNAIKLLHKLIILQIHNLTFRTVIMGIVIVISSIVIGISSIFIMNKNKLWIGINLIWIIFLFINLIMFSICYKKDKKNGIIQNFDLDDNETKNNSYQQVNYEQQYCNNYNIQYQNTQIIKHKELLTKKDYNLLIFFSSLIFVGIIAYIILMVLFIYTPMDKFYETQITNNGSELKIITPDGYKIIAVSLITSLCIMTSIIATPIMNNKINKKIKLFDNKNNIGYTKQIKITTIISIVSFVISCVIISCLYKIKLNNDALITLYTLIIILGISFASSMIICFIFTILSKRQAIKLNYFQKSLQLFKKYNNFYYGNNKY